MIRIMFVCHGNICRSPMAEFIFKDIIKKRGISDEFYVSSSATSSEEIWGYVGNPVYPPARDELKKHGISCKGKRAVQLQKSDYDKYDMFIGMDSNNIRNMLRIFGSDPKNKIHKMMDYTTGGNVDDPWYTGNFKLTYANISSACKAMIDSLTGKM